MFAVIYKWEIRKRIVFFISLALTLVCSANAAQTIESPPPEENQKTWSVTFNAGELAGFTMGSALLGVGYLPLHFDANYLISKCWQLNLGLVFRYDWGSFIGPEIIGMAGARYSFSGTGLFGSFASLKAGPGYVTGTNNTSFGVSPGTYTSFEFCFQPEAGYSYPLGSNGYLTLGGGILFIIATPQGSGQGGGWSLLGVIVHQIVPVLDVGLGFTF